MSDPTSAHKPYTTGARPFSAAQKLNVTATSSGWVRVQDSDSYKYSGNDNPATTPEVLVAIRNLAARLTPLISGFSWTSPSNYILDKSAGGTLTIVAHFSQAVVYTGRPSLLITNDTPARNHTLSCPADTAAGGSGTEELIFTAVIAAGAATFNAGDVLSIANNPMGLAGGTIKAVSDAENANIESVIAIGAAAGTVAVIA